jgi:hypothetical protein
MDELDFEAWLQYGVSKGWAGAPVCEPHDGLPMTEEEETEYAEGNDPCIHIIRLYESQEEKDGVEENHSASVWRASNRGLEL